MSITYRMAFCLAWGSTGRAFILACANHCNVILDAMLQEVVGVNLVNQKGSELVLSKAFEEQAAAFARSSRGFRLVTFDFHKECGATSYHKCVCTGSKAPRVVATGPDETGTSMSPMKTLPCESCALQQRCPVESSTAAQ